MFYKKTINKLKNKINFLEYQANENRIFIDQSCKCNNDINRKIRQLEEQNETIVQVISDEKKEINEKIELANRMIKGDNKVIQLLSKAIEEDRNKMAQIIEVIKYICAKQGIILNKKEVKTANENKKKGK